METRETRRDSSEQKQINGRNDMSPRDISPQATSQRLHRRSIPSQTRKSSGARARGEGGGETQTSPTRGSSRAHLTSSPRQQQRRRGLCAGRDGMTWVKWGSCERIDSLLALTLLAATSCTNSSTCSRATCSIW
eukprot:762015-Hanusia_phi.AAC.3